MSMRSPFSSMLRVLVVVSVGAVLAACAGDGPPPRSFPQLGWDHLPPFEFATNGPQITESFSNPNQEPHVEHLMPVPPSQAMRIWVGDRIRATGAGTETLRLDIREASVVEKPLPTKSGVTGFFTNEPEVRYEGRATVALQVLDPSGRVEAEVTASTWRTKEILEKASLAQREQMWFDLVEAMVNDLDSQLSQGIPQYLGRWMLAR